jgi:thiaminase
MLAHHFLNATGKGRISDAAFAAWMRQDFVYVAQGTRFVSRLATEQRVSFENIP